MKKSALWVSLIVLGVPLGAQTPAPASKVGIIHIQNALISTQDGKKAVGELQARFEPTSKKLEGMRDQISSLQNELNKGSNTMGEERRRELARDIDQKTRELNRATEDAQGEFQQEQEKLLQTLGQKMMAVISKYSGDNGFTLILDVSNPQTPVLFAANNIDITAEIIKLYDVEAAKAAAATAPAAPAKPAASAAAPPPPASGVKR